MRTARRSLDSTWGAGHPELMTDPQPKGMTDFQKSLLENPQWTL
ncbi:MULTISPECIES: hypothetical protein [unclassified Curtobacterium]|nr:MULTISPECIES: hypothetical protein [unclassified Curtobacterium]